MHFQHDINLLIYLYSTIAMSVVEGSQIPQKYENSTQ